MERCNNKKTKTENMKILEGQNEGKREEIQSLDFALFLYRFVIRGSS